MGAFWIGWPPSQPEAAFVSACGRCSPTKAFFFGAKLVMPVTISPTVYCIPVVVNSRVVGNLPAQYQVTVIVMCQVPTYLRSVRINTSTRHHNCPENIDLGGTKGCGAGFSGRRSARCWLNPRSRQDEKDMHFSYPTEVSVSFPSHLSTTLSTRRRDSGWVACSCTLHYTDPVTGTI